MTQLIPQTDHWRAGIQLLAEGKYELGWRLWETRPINMGGRAPGKPILGVPEWDGSKIGSLLILPEQGLGDQIMFARYAPFLRDSGMEVTIMCHPLLVRLFESLGVSAVSAQGRVAIPNVDAWALGPSLPFLCKTTLENIPPAPYLSARPRNTVDGNVGVLVRGNPNYPLDAIRSLDAASAEEIKALPGAVSLAVEDTDAKDLLDTAELIAGLDLVISVDTAVAHLAGALGKPCFLMLPFNADWRWMKDRHDSPWYPSLTLFRQPKPGDWVSVVSRVRSHLPPA